MRHIETTKLLQKPTQVAHSVLTFRTKTSLALSQTRLTARAAWNTVLGNTTERPSFGKTALTISSWPPKNTVSPAHSRRHSLFKYKITLKSLAILLSVCGN